MDNFKIRNKSKTDSVDGMLPSASSGRKKKSSARLDSQLSPRNTLDNFAMSEGFHPAEQPEIDDARRPDNVGRNPNRDKSGKIDLSLPSISIDKGHGVVSNVFSEDSPLLVSVCC